MKKLLTSSAMFLSFIGILGLLVLGYFKGVEVAPYITLIAIGTSASRAAEAMKLPK